VNVLSLRKNSSSACPGFGFDIPAKLACLVANILGRDSIWIVATGSLTELCQGQDRADMKK
jgi:hypothetical protein